MKKFVFALSDPKLAPIALRVSDTVGSVLFTINHGAALVRGEMTKTLWLSGLVTYLVPESVSIHGQHTNRRRSIKN